MGRAEEEARDRVVDPLPRAMCVASTVSGGESADTRGRLTVTVSERLE